MFLLRFDLRIPPFVDSLTPTVQYGEMLEMVRWADGEGFAGVVLSEHHGSEDGFMNAPLAVAGAVLGATRNLFCSVSALLLPLHDPLRVAEDVAALDLLAPGRLNVVIGIGYRESEFEMFGRDRSRRGAEAEAGIRTILRAWEGEPFEVDGRTVWVTPKPASDPHSLLAVGGSVEASARRAARLHLPFIPAIGDRALLDAYLLESAACGHEAPFCAMPSGPGLVIVTRDPDRLWGEIGPNLVYDASVYASWQYPDQRTSWMVEADDIDQLRAGGQHLIVTPEECVELVRADGVVVLHPLCGGIDPAIGWESLHLVANEVMPALAG
jgi:alkanesulfonate monooxygenase SsuD/methylene tetrahydromethanopterin reductase-like flavin-dependent oxidoreductase (luciferase family)|tara:strand:- start:1778 stop:2752 length:975 start_codon:yes stop_codon:yes gene_type:complete